MNHINGTEKRYSSINKNAEPPRSSPVVWPSWRRNTYTKLTSIIVSVKNFGPQINFKCVWFQVPKSLDLHVRITSICSMAGATDMETTAFLPNEIKINIELMNRNRALICMTKKWPRMSSSKSAVVEKGCHETSLTRKNAKRPESRIMFIFWNSNWAQSWPSQVKKVKLLYQSAEGVNCGPLVASSPPKDCKMHQKQCWKDGMLIRWRVSDTERAKQLTQNWPCHSKTDV